MAMVLDLVVGVVEAIVVLLLPARAGLVMPGAGLAVMPVTIAGAVAAQNDDAVAVLAVVVVLGRLVVLEGGGELEELGPVPVLLGHGQGRGVVGGGIRGGRAGGEKALEEGGTRGLDDLHGPLGGRGETQAPQKTKSIVEEALTDVDQLLLQHPERGTHFGTVGPALSHNLKNL